jgi:hypothetical protein
LFASIFKWSSKDFGNRSEMVSVEGFKFGNSVRVTFE